MTIAKLEWDDVNFINSLKTKEATAIQIREIDGEKKFVLTFDETEVKAKRVEELARSIQCMRTYMSSRDEELNDDVRPNVEYKTFKVDYGVVIEPMTWTQRILNWLRIY